MQSLNEIPVVIHVKNIRIEELRVCIVERAISSPQRVSENFSKLNLESECWMNANSKLLYKIAFC